MTGTSSSDEKVNDVSKEGISSTIGPRYLKELNY